MYLTLILSVLTLPAGGQDAVADARTAFQQANALFEKTENEKALAAYDKAIALDPKQPDYHVGRCRTLARLMRHKEAIDSCTDALKLDPNNAPALLERGHFLINVRQADKALPDLLQARKLGADPYGSRTTCRSRITSPAISRGRRRSTEQCYPNAKTDDNRVGCLAWQYVALLRAGRKADADKVLERITPDTSVQSSVAYLDRLLLFKGVKKEEEVAQAMQKDNLQLPTVAYGVGVWHLVNGRQDRAREVLRKGHGPARAAERIRFGRLLLRIAANEAVVGCCHDAARARE